ncbi:helix-turn-helix transcriptional regulator [Serratia liquefaciens]|uniref:helix-turn-helix transcriptional regulator n=1 Tax=Serratia liquefaciens TaxID=614 RepID=UPI0037F29100
MNVRRCYLSYQYHNILIVASCHAARDGLLIFTRRIVSMATFIATHNKLALLPELVKSLRPANVMLILHDVRDMHRFFYILPNLKKQPGLRLHIFISWRNAVGLSFLRSVPRANVIDIHQSLPMLLRDLSDSLSGDYFLSESLKPYCAYTPLSTRETYVLFYLSVGLSLGEIATIFGCQKKGVQQYRAQAMRKLFLENRSEFLRWLPFWRSALPIILTPSFSGITPLLIND